MKKVPLKVLVGGCFDMLHPGHITFLKKAKEAGERLVVLLESDEKIKKLKGKNRPFQNQRLRAHALKQLGFIDEIVSLPFMQEEKDYDELIKRIKPDIIAVTKDYPGITHQKRVANLVGAELRVVTEVVEPYSTTRLIGKKVV